MATRKKLSLSETSKKKTTTRKKKTTTKKAAPKKTSPPVSTSRQALLDKINKSFSGAARMNQGGRRGNFNYVKLGEKDRHVFRLVLPPNGPPVIAYKQQRGRRGGNFGTAVDLSWLTSPNTQELYPDILDELQKTFAITEEDLELINEHGEPYNKLWDSLQALGEEDQFMKARIGSKRAITVVYYEKEFSILESSLTVASTFQSYIEENPDLLLDWQNARDIIIKGRGKGFKGPNKRQYDPPIIAPRQGKKITYNEDEQTIPNLYDVLGSKVLGYKDKVKFLFNSHRALVDEAQLTMADFGVDDESE